MKKLMLCALIGLSLCACKSKKAENGPDSTGTNPHDTSERAFRMVNIGVDTAVKMVAGNYKERMVLGRDGKMKEDARTVYFDLPSLKKLIANIENEKGEGIRIYFAAYDNGHVIANAVGKELDYSNSTTVVLVSTKDTLIVDPDNPANKITIHKDYFSRNKSIKTYGYFTGRTDPQNKGELCPPPSPCCKIGATLLCTPPPTGN